MRLIHTSDWHLGRTLFGVSRVDEQRAILDWLIGVIKRERADVLLVCGDIFETSTPSNSVQQMYFDFLSRASALCRCIVIIRGNHDSASLLSAPKELFKTLNIFVTGEPSENIEDDVILLKDGEKPEALICPIAYMHDPQAFLKHCSDILSAAEKKREQLLNGEKIPIIISAHLTAKYMDGEGFRDFTNLKDEAVELESFADRVDYFALGHIHTPMTVNGARHIRYSGSLTSTNPMKNSAASKQVVLAEFTDTDRRIEEIYIPEFQKIIYLEGNVENIAEETESLVKAGISAWILVRYSGLETEAEVWQKLTELSSESENRVKIVHIEKILEEDNVYNEETPMDTRDPLRFFQRFLEMKNIPEEEREEITAAFREILADGI
jgi:exonuclease SbcD